MHPNADQDIFLMERLYNPELRKQSVLFLVSFYEPCCGCCSCSVPESLQQRLFESSYYPTLQRDFAPARSLTKAHLSVDIE